MNKVHRTLGFLQQSPAAIGILIGWEMGHLSEGQAAEKLETDRVTAREFKQWAITNEVILDRSAERVEEVKQ